MAEPSCPWKRSILSNTTPLNQMIQCSCYAFFVISFGLFIDQQFLMMISKLPPDQKKQSPATSVHFWRCTWSPHQQCKCPKRFFVLQLLFRSSSHLIVGTAASADHTNYLLSQEGFSWVITASQQPLCHWWKSTMDMLRNDVCKIERCATPDLLILQLRLYPGQTQWSLYSQGPSYDGVRRWFI